MKNDTNQNVKTDSSTETPEWLLDLDKVGFVRRLFIARKWYGGDWWFVAISSVLLIFIILVGIFPNGSPPTTPQRKLAPHCWHRVKRLLPMC